MRALLIILACILLNSCDTITDNNPVNSLSGLSVINIIADDEDLIKLLNNRFTDLEIPVKVGFEGNTFSANLRASGAGSRYYPKISFRLIMKDNSIKGIKDFSLSAQPFDKTFIRTAVASYLYSSAGFPVFYSEPVFLTLNNTNYGIYNFIERIKTDFFARRGMPLGELYKVQFDAHFTFKEEGRMEEGFSKEFPDDDNYSSLADLISASDNVAPANIPSVMGRYMDIERYLWYHVISTIRSDPDSYTNNFYLYKETLAEPFSFIPWDFDKTFTGNIGFYGYNELIESLFRNKDIVSSYTAKLGFTAEHIFTESNLFPIIDGLYNRMAEYYKYDPYLVNTNIEKEVEGIKNFISKRRQEIKEIINN